MSFFTPEGLSQLAGIESSNNPTVVNSSGHAGLYQFSPTLWTTYAPQAGVDTNLYPTADTAPASVQTQVAQITPASNWLCHDCDAPITAAVASNPALLASSPVTANGSGSSALSFSAPDVAADGSSTGDGITLSPSDALWTVLAGGGAADALTGGSNVAGTNPTTTGIPGTSPDTSGLLAAGSAAANVLPALAATVSDWLTRGGLILLGIILVGVAAWAFASGDIQKTARRAFA